MSEINFSKYESWEQLLNGRSRHGEESVNCKLACCKHWYSGWWFQGSQSVSPDLHDRLFPRTLHRCHVGPKKEADALKLGERNPREESNCWSGCCSPYDSITGTENCRHRDPRDASSRCTIWPAEISNFLGGLWHLLLSWFPLQCVSFRTKHMALATWSRPLYWKQWIDLK